MHQVKSPISLLICDLDYFKDFNDTYGHQLGDDCLKKVARAMTQSVKRPADLVARYGGEEFVLVLPNSDDTDARHVAHTLHKTSDVIVYFQSVSKTNKKTCHSLYEISSMFFFSM